MRCDHRTGGVQVNNPVHHCSCQAGSLGSVADAHVNKPDEMLPGRTEEHIPADLIIDEPENELSLVSGCFESGIWEMSQRCPALPVKLDYSLEVLILRLRFGIPDAGRERTSDGQINGHVTTSPLGSCRGCGLESRCFHRPPDRQNVLPLVGARQRLLNHFEVVIGLLPETITFELEVVVERFSAARKPLCFLAELQSV